MVDKARPTSALASIGTPTQEVRDRAALRILQEPEPYELLEILGLIDPRPHLDAESCPTCGAAPGARCRSERGNNLRKPHAPRRVHTITEGEPTDAR